MEDNQFNITSRKIKIYLLLLIIIKAGTSCAQSVFMNGYSDTSIANTYSGKATNAMQLSGNDYVFCTEFGYISRTNNVGLVQWTKLLDAPGANNFILLQNCILGNNNNIYATGFYDNGDTACVAKINSNGSLIWSLTFASPLMQFDRIKEMGNGDIILTGFYRDPVYLSYYAAVIRISSLGTILWQRVYLHPFQTGLSGHGNSAINDVAETSNGDLLFCGACENVSSSVGNFILKTNASGTIQWAKQISPFTVPSVNKPFRIIELTNGNIKLVIQHPIQGPTGHIGIAETNSAGMVLNANAFNDTLSFEMSDAYLDANGNSAVVAGSATYFFNSNNILQQGYSYLPQYSMVVLNGINKANDGGYIIGGAIFLTSPFFSDALLTKTTSTGETTAGRYLPVGLTTASYSLNSQTVSMVDSIIDIDINASILFTSAIILKDTVFSAIVGLNELLNSQSHFDLYPNPAEKEVTVAGLKMGLNEKCELKIFDVLGKEVFQSAVSSRQLMVDVSKFENGIYFVQLTAEKLSSSSKLIIQH